MTTNEVETQSNTTVNMEIPANINYDECCLFGDKTVHTYGQNAKHGYYRLMNSILYTFCYQIDHHDWSRECVTFSYLSEFDIRSYLKQNKVISIKEADNIVVNEKNLI